MLSGMYVCFERYAAKYTCVLNDTQQSVHVSRMIRSGIYVCFERYCDAAECTCALKDTQRSFERYAAERTCVSNDTQQILYLKQK
jgi:hypothetical protein